MFASLDKTIKGAGGRGLQDMVTMIVFTTSGSVAASLNPARNFSRTVFQRARWLGSPGSIGPESWLKSRGVAMVGGK